MFENENENGNYIKTWSLLSFHCFLPPFPSALGGTSESFFSISLIFHSSLPFLLLSPPPLLLPLRFVYFCSHTHTHTSSSATPPTFSICHYDFLTRADPRRPGPHQRFS